MKKTVALIIALVLMVFASVVHAQDIVAQGKCGRYVEWCLHSDGTFVVTGMGEMVYETSEAEYAMAELVPWKEYIWDIKKVYIDNGITEICRKAFYGCKNLEEVTLPETMYTIGDEAFCGCPELEKIDIPESVQIIGKGAFENCRKLSEVNVPFGVSEISDRVFSGCEKLEKVTIPNSVTAIGSQAFNHCLSLKGVSLYNNLKTIGAMAFSNCKSIEEIIIPQTVVQIDEMAFSTCENLKKITILGSVQKFDSQLVSFCGRLEEINIPHSVKRIEEGAFWGCNSLKDIYYDGTKEDWNGVYIRAMTLPEHLSYKDIHYLREAENEEPNVETPAEKTDSEEITVYEKPLEEQEKDIITENTGDTQKEPEYEAETEKELEKDISSLTGKCGENLNWLLDKNNILTITGYGGMYEDIARHDYGWHDYREDIKDIIFPEEIESIGEYAFWKCTSLKDVIIPDSVKVIYKNAFSHCDELTSVTFPDSVINVERGAFRESDKLTIYCNGNSQAHIYAQDNDINYVLTETTEEKQPVFITSEWAKAEVTEAYKNNLIPETMLKQDLTKVVTRAEFAAIAVKLYEALEQKKVNPGHNPFDDIYNNKYYNEIVAAYDLGVTTGTSPITFEPDEKITREQLATMLCRVIKKRMYKDWSPEKDADFTLDIRDVEKFEDDADISEYAKQSVYFMVKKGIIKGISSTKFAPRNITEYQEETEYASATVEQALIMSLRTYNNK